MKLLLGCGDDYRPGWVHHDLTRHGEHVDVAHDLNVYPWPWADDAAEEIEALDVLEHLADTVGFMDECWRILQPGGTLTVRVPDWRSENAWIDPTHRRAFHSQTFAYFDSRSNYWARYGRLYTNRPWHLAHLVPGDNIIAVMRPVK